MRIELQHKRLRCEKIGESTYLADDYQIIACGSNTVLGSCELRHAPIELLPYSGHVSYTVYEPYRGRGIARSALEKLVELARERGVRDLWITASAENLASVRVCTGVGAVFVDEVSVLGLEEFAERGITRICRYRIRTDRDF